MPVLPLALSLVMHAGPRVLKAGGCASEAATVTNSIVAGCAYANHPSLWGTGAKGAVKYSLSSTSESERT